MKRVFYIMIEGGDGCGKGTQLILLEKYLLKKNYDVVTTKEPGGTFESEQIRKILLKKQNNLSPETEFFLYLAARSDNYEKIVIPGLEEGKIVLKDRGWPSTIAYQGFGGGMMAKEIIKQNKKATFGIKPDLLIILDVDAKTGLEKEQNPDRFAAKGEEYHEKVRKGYLWVAEKFSDISVVIPYKEGDVQGIHEKIKKYIGERLGI